MACLALALPATAAGESGSLSPDQAAAAVQQAVGDTALAHDAPVSDAAPGAHNGTTVSVPPAATGAIMLTNGDGQPALGIGIPGSAAAEQTENATVYASGERDIVAQALADGSLRLAVTIPGADSPTEYRYPLRVPEGVDVSLDEDGGVNFVRRNGDEDQPSLVVGRIETPWATDAAGNAVPTAFRLDGDTLVQRIDFTATSAFPVVADPSVIWKWALFQWESSSAAAKPRARATPSSSRP